MKHEDGNGQEHGGYHHGNLREALVQAALTLIAERGVPGFAVAELARILGVSAAAPYRHFRDRDSLVAELARRGFEALRSELTSTVQNARANPVAVLEQCAQAHLAYAGREAAVYSTMFDQQLPISAHPKLLSARNAAFLVLRKAAVAACASAQASRPPPPHMVALHVWSLTHGIATLFLGRSEDTTGWMPMKPAELLEAGLLIYLQSLDLKTRP